MRKSFICIMFIVATRTHAQDIDWQQTSIWKLYDTRSIRSLGTPIEKILQSKSAFLDSVDIKNFLSAVTKMPSADAPVWMGYYVVSCVTKEGELKLFYISVYGGFFYDRDKKIYYQVAEDARKEWLDYFSQAEVALQISK
jgi:hypothetical protein